MANLGSSIINGVLRVIGKIKANSVEATTISATTITGALDGNAATATKLQTARTINNVAFDGSANITLPNASTSVNGLMSSTDKSKLDNVEANANNYSHPNSGISAGTYQKVTVNAQGHVTGGTNPTTLSGYGITDATPSSHIGTGGAAHANATTSVDGFMSATDKATFDKVTTTKTATITTTWTGTSAPYTQDITVSGITASDTPIVDIVLSSTAATALTELNEWNKVSRIVTGAGKITVYCYAQKPTVAMNIQLKGI